MLCCLEEREDVLHQDLDHLGRQVVAHARHRHEASPRDAIGGVAATGSVMTAVRLRTSPGPLLLMVSGIVTSDPALVW